MAIRVFLDVNIILDIIDDQRLHHKIALIILELLKTHKIQGFISESIFTNTSYILNKIIGKKATENFLSSLIKTIQILPCETNHCEDALNARFTDLEDALIFHIASSNRLDYLITNDTAFKKKFADEKVKLISSKEFIGMEEFIL